MDRIEKWFPVLAILFGTFFFYLLSVSQNAILEKQQAINASQAEILRSLDLATADRQEALKVLHDLAIPEKCGER